MASIQTRKEATPPDAQPRFSRTPVPPAGRSHSGQIPLGDYPPGFRIPSEHALANHYRIGRPTARQATDLLVRKRLLTRRRGAGTFVCDRQPEVDLFSLAGTTSAFHRTGITVATTLIEPMQLATNTGDPENPSW